MLNTKDVLIRKLSELNLSNHEAQLYLELLKGPNTHLKLAHATGINRTKVYRLADQLEKRSLITMRTDDRGTFLVAADPATLEVEVVTQEEKVKGQRAALSELLPTLANIKRSDSSTFVVHTYEGVEGFKQMLWHELKTQGEELILGRGNIKDFADNTKWADKHRLMTVEAGYTIRKIHNPEPGLGVGYTLPQAFMDRYTARNLDPKILELKQQIAIYNDTVATYNWRKGQNVGFEIINAGYANTMRQIFETYWQLTTPIVR
jgi:hypothetical protein